MEPKKPWRNIFLTIAVTILTGGTLAQVFGFIDLRLSKGSIIETDEKVRLLKELELYKSQAIDYRAAIEELREESYFLKSNIQLVGAIDNQFDVFVWLKHKDGKILYVNKFYEENILAYQGKSSKDVIGKTDIEVWGSKIGKEYRKNDLDLLADGSSIYVIEKAYVHGKLQDVLSIKSVRKIGMTIIGTGGIGIPMTYINKAIQNKK